MTNAPIAVHAQGGNIWIVDVGTRVYRAQYLDDDNVFPLDRWRVRNAYRRQYLPWDSPTLRTVVYAIKRSLNREAGQ